MNMLGMDIDKLNEGADALVRMAAALERLTELAEYLCVDDDEPRRDPAPEMD